MSAPTPSPDRSSSSSAASVEPNRGERLQKVLAAAGFGSRRACEELILEGRVEVDRQVVTKLGTRVDPDSQEIRLDGTPLRRTRKVYYLLNKPAGVLSTNRDPSGRMRVIDLLPDKERIFTVGRLDKSSEGLMLVTNDGTLANRLAHPRYEIAKRYLVTVVGQPTQESLDILRRGIHLAEGRVQVQELTVKKRAPRQTTLEMVLTEGRNREIRRMAARVGHKVVGLKRIAIGPLRLMNMPTGAFRELTRHEVAQLYELAHLRGAPSAATDKQPAAVERPSSAARPTRRPTRKTSRRPEGAPPRRTTAKPTGRKSSYSHSRDNTGQNSEPSTRKPGKKKTPFGTRSSGRPATGGTTGRKPSGRKPSGRKPDGRKPYEKKPYGRKPHDSQKSNATGGTVIGGDDFEQERTESRTRSGRPNQQQRRGKFAKGKFAKGKSRRPSTDRGTQRGKRKGSR